MRVQVSFPASAIRDGLRHGHGDQTRTKSCLAEQDLLIKALFLGK